MEVNDPDSKLIFFTMGGLFFEYDETKNQKNIKKHGISFKSAVRVFFDYDRIELYDEENSIDEDRFDTIGDVSKGMILNNETIIGNVGRRTGHSEDIFFVVYTERVRTTKEGKEINVSRIISARFATNFERGLYYGKYE